MSDFTLSMCLHCGHKAGGYDDWSFRGRVESNDWRFPAGGSVRVWACATCGGLMTPDYRTHQGSWQILVEPADATWREQYTEDEARALLMDGRSPAELSRRREFNTVK